MEERKIELLVETKRETKVAKSKPNEEVYIGCFYGTYAPHGENLYAIVYR
jgi:hypothetical protein